MKTLKLTIAAIALLFVSISANAAPKADKATKTDVVNTYIDAISNGTTKSLDKVLGDDLQFDTQHGDKVNTMNKATLLKYMNNDAVSTPPVNTSTTIMQDDDTSEKVKISFNYDGLVRTDVVTLNYSFGWKITNVTSSYK